jgi:hypothetical protein
MGNWNMFLFFKTPPSHPALEGIEAAHGTIQDTKTARRSTAAAVGIDTWTRKIGKD